VNVKINGFFDHFCCGVWINHCSNHPDIKKETIDGVQFKHFDSSPKLFQVFKAKSGTGTSRSKILK
jgi:hypothetical protein